MLPGGEETDNVINAAVLEKLGPEGVFVNVGRGNAVDDSALVHALEAGKIRAAGLDVYKNEPSIPEAYTALNNVILLPHVGSATVETRREMGNLVMQNIARYLCDNTLMTEVDEG
jgi:lactate dehydrogenase-like 2-hydroxyacid dehydrogenase